MPWPHFASAAPVRRRLRPPSPRVGGCAAVAHRPGAFSLSVSFFPSPLPYLCLPLPPLPSSSPLSLSHSPSPLPLPRSLSLFPLSLFPLSLSLPHSVLLSISLSAFSLLPSFLVVATPKSPSLSQSHVRFLRSSCALPLAIPSASDNSTSAPSPSASVKQGCSLTRFRSMLAISANKPAICPLQNNSRRRVKTIAVLIRLE